MTTAFLTVDVELLDSSSKVCKTILSCEVEFYKTSTVFHIKDRISTEFDNKTGTV